MNKEQAEIISDLISGQSLAIATLIDFLHKEGVIDKNRAIEYLKNTVLNAEKRGHEQTSLMALNHASYFLDSFLLSPDEFRRKTAELLQSL